MDTAYPTGTLDPTTTTLITIVSLVLVVAMIVALWKMFTKAGEHGWAAIVPFYNSYVLFKVAGYNGWMFLLMIIPVVNFVVGILLAIELGRRFNKGGVWSFFLLFVFSVIGYLILGFNQDSYTPRGHDEPRPHIPDGGTDFDPLPNRPTY